MSGRKEIIKWQYLDIQVTGEVTWKARPPPSAKI